MATAWSLVDVLEKAGRNLTRQALLDQLNTLNETDNRFLFVGTLVKNTPNDHYSVTQEYVARYDAAANDWKPISQPVDVRGQIKFP